MALPSTTSMTAPSQHERAALPAKQQWCPGDRFERYSVLGEIGRGGMGRVLDAYDPQLERRVAIKVLTHDTIEADQRVAARMRLHREARALAHLSHPNIVTIYDVGTVDDTLFLVMERLEGVSLAAWMAQPEHAQRSWQEIIRVLSSAARGLQAAHSSGLIHRDFKPDNLMVEPNGRVVVLDFGIVGASQPDPSSAPLTSKLAPITQREHSVASEVTQAGDIMGTPAYMAPEQHAGAQADERCDQFAFCVTLYEALHGVRPFPGRTQSAIARRARAGVFERPSVSRQVPRWLQHALRRGLEAERDRRFSTLGELIELFEMRTRPPRWRGWAAAASIATLSIAAVLATTSEAQRDTRCDAAPFEFDSVWNANTRAQIAGRYRNLSAAWASDTWTRVQRGFDDYASTWSTARHENCLATHIHQTQSDRSFDLQSRCLNLARVSATALVGALSDGRAPILQRAVETIEGLPSLRRCGDVEQLKSGQPWPIAEDRRGRVEELRAELQTINTRKSAGVRVGHQVAIDALLERARAEGYVPVLAEIYNLSGSIARVRGDIDEAIARQRKALQLAVASGHRELAARVEIRLIFLVGYAQRDVDQGTDLMHSALARVHALGSPPYLHAMVLSRAAILDDMKGRRSMARKNFERALELTIESHGERSLLTARMLDNLALATQRMGQVQRSIELTQRSLAMQKSINGDRHPELATAMDTLGNSLMRAWSWSAGMNVHLEALDICESSSGVGQIPCAFHAHSAAHSLRQVGHLSHAVAVLEPYVALEQRLGRRLWHTVPWLNTEQARTLDAMGASERAAQHIESIASVISQTPESTPRFRVEAITTMATNALARGEIEAGRRGLRRAIELHLSSRGYPASAGLNEVVSSELLAAVGHAELAHGDTRIARDIFERIAQRVLHGHDAVDPGLPAALVALATSYRRLGKPDEAEATARAALEYYLHHGHEREAMRVAALVELGEVHLALDQPELALSNFVRARQLDDPTQSLPARWAPAIFGTARALAAAKICLGGARGDAEQLAREALELLASSPHSQAAEVARVRAWLHRPTAS